MKLEQLQELLGNPDKIIEAANVTAAAYCKAKGEQIVVLDANSPEAVAQNCAALFAIVAGIQALVSVDRGEMALENLEDDFSWWLNFIANSDGDPLKDPEMQTLLLFANATWMAGQPFRGGDLSKATRGNIFYLLDDETKLKDWVQIQTIARWLQDQLED